MHLRCGARDPEFKSRRFRPPNSIRYFPTEGENMTWQELFEELSTSQSAAFRAGDIVKLRHTIAGIETFVRNYHDVGCPDHAAPVPEPIVSHIRKEMALKFPGGGR